MAPAGGGGAARLGRIAAVVAGGAVAVTAAGLAWSYLRAGALRLTYVREAQFLVGLGLLAAWTVRNRRGHPDRGPDAGGRRAETAETGGTVRDPAARGTGSRPDPYLLGLGLLLLGLSLGGELLGGYLG